MNEPAQGLSAGRAELVHSLRTYLEGIEFNPKRLDQVEDRLALINNLKRKYGDTIPAILDFVKEAQQQLDAITHARERIQELEEEESSLLVQLAREGATLSQKRQEKGEHLAGAIEAELDHLQMSSAKFLVDFRRRPDPQGVPMEDGERVAFDANGVERVEFLIAPNPGEGFRPMAKIASGGETSRLMLALKNVLANADQVPTLIFDEIDQGIGGRVGGIVGQKLWALSRQHQELCVTHLPQLAAYGGQHFQVMKQVRDGRTTTTVQLLQGDRRLVELAQMFGEVSEGTLRSAREMLQAVDERVTEKPRS
jgi:DNA repair protein RecN (Recombination protein N)